MNILETLSRFCDTESSRYSLQQPWFDGGWTIATDGKVLVAVPWRVQGVRTFDDIKAAGDRVPDCKSVFESAGLGIMRSDKGSSKWHPWPGVDIDKPPGTNDRWEWFVPCPDCGGDKCCSAGWERHGHGDGVILIGDAWAAIPYVWLVGQLERVEYYVRTVACVEEHERFDKTPIGFRFEIDGETGYGALCRVSKAVQK
jgi:hypothetical protein